jgi:hypothetical protein
MKKVNKNSRRFKVWIKPKAATGITVPEEPFTNNKTSSPQELYGPILGRANDVYYDTSFGLGNRKEEEAIVKNKGILEDLYNPADSVWNFNQNKYIPRNLPPMDSVLLEMQNKIKNLPKENADKLMRIDWMNRGIGIKDIPTIYSAAKESGTNIKDLSKYYNHMKELMDNGYTYEKGGTVINKDMKRKKYAKGALVNALEVASEFSPLVGTLFNIGTGIAGMFSKNKEKEDAAYQAELARISGVDQMQNSMQAGIVNPYQATFPYGGVTPEGVPIEVEKGEVFRDPRDGSLAKVSEGAPSHAGGGVDVSAEPGTQIYGKLKVKSGRFKGISYKDAADKIRKEIDRLEKN